MLIILKNVEAGLRVGLGGIESDLFLKKRFNERKAQESEPERDVRELPYSQVTWTSETESFLI
jgi:hypothetical protein